MTKVSSFNRIFYFSTHLKNRPNQKRLKPLEKGVAMTAFAVFSVLSLGVLPAIILYGRWKHHKVPNLKPTQGKTDLVGTGAIQSNQTSTNKPLTNLQKGKTPAAAPTTTVQKGTPSAPAPAPPPIANISEFPYKHLSWNELTKQVLNELTKQVLTDKQNEARAQSKEWDLCRELFMRVLKDFPENPVPDDERAILKAVISVHEQEKRYLDFIQKHPQPDDLIILSATLGLRKPIWNTAFALPSQTTAKLMDLLLRFGPPPLATGMKPLELAVELAYNAMASGDEEKQKAIFAAIPLKSGSLDYFAAFFVQRICKGASFDAVSDVWNQIKDPHAKQRFAYYLVDISDDDHFDRMWPLIIKLPKESWESFPFANANFSHTKRLYAHAKKHNNDNIIQGLRTFYCKATTDPFNARSLIKLGDPVIAEHFLADYKLLEYLAPQDAEDLLQQLSNQWWQGAFKWWEDAFRTNNLLRADSEFVCALAKAVGKCPSATLSDKGNKLAQCLGYITSIIFDPKEAQQRVQTALIAAFDHLTEDECYECGAYLKMHWDTLASGLAKLSWNGPKQTRFSSAL